MERSDSMTVFEILRTCSDWDTKIQIVDARGCDKVFEEGSIFDILNKPSIYLGSEVLSIITNTSTLGIAVYERKSESNDKYFTVAEVLAKYTEQGDFFCDVWIYDNETENLISMDSDLKFYMTTSKYKDYLVAYHHKINRMSQDVDSIILYIIKPLKD